MISHQPKVGGRSERKAPVRLFPASEKKRIIALVVAEPSGVEVTVGGIVFDLVALSTGEMVGLLDVVTRVAELYDKLLSGELSEADILHAIARDGSNILSSARSLLFRSAGLDNDDPDLDGDRETFAAWYERLAVRDLLIAIGPRILEANGLTIARPPQATPSASSETPESEISTPSTPSDSSSHISRPTTSKDAGTD